MAAATPLAAIAGDRYGRRPVLLIAGSAAFLSGFLLAPMLGTLHNLWYYQRLMAGIRAAVEAGRFADFRAAFHAARAVGAAGTD